MNGLEQRLEHLTHGDHLHRVRLVPNNFGLLIHDDQNTLLIVATNYFINEIFKQLKYFCDNRRLHPNSRRESNALRCNLFRRIKATSLDRPRSPSPHRMLITFGLEPWRHRRTGWSHGLNVRKLPVDSRIGAHADLYCELTAARRPKAPPPARVRRSAQQRHSDDTQ
ncbi:hypothetical protein AB0L82_31650 [Nocardia sp. NPDC052001]|uniref:hypothetical protein n=1 Tax=Nocardia sp. NPDC052001 TaxID=3154853 RepID=UPI00343AA075